MSSLIPQGGATGSGLINLVAPATNNNSTQTLPDATGTLLSTGAPQPGGVIQVVQLATTASASTGSSSWVSTGVSASITPKFATSKILIMISGQLYETPSGQQGFMTVYRGATELSGQTNGFPPSIYSNNSVLVGSASMNYLDSPATTSSTTYTIYIRTTGNTLYWNGAGALTTIILMEVAA